MAIANPGKQPHAPQQRARGSETTIVRPPMAGSAAQVKKARIDPSPAFLYKAHPERFFVLEGRVVPQLAKVKLQGGINGVREAMVSDGMGGRERRIFATDAIAKAQAAGWTVIPLDVDGEGTSYLRHPAGRPDVNMARWTRTYPGSNRMDADTKGFSEWLGSLITRGVVAPPASYVLERMESELQADVSRLADLATTVPSAGALLLNAQKSLAVVTAEYQASLDELEPSAVEIPTPALTDIDPTSKPKPGRKK